MAAKNKKSGPDVIDQAVDTGLDISGMIYEIPYSFFQQGVETALELKDQLKKSVGLNPAKQNGRPVYLYKKNGKGWNHERTLNPVRQGEWSRFVRLSQQNPDAYRLVRFPGMKKNGRRNPEEGASKFFEKFHGEPSESTVVVEKAFHEHTHLGGIGPLVECWIESVTGLLACLSFPHGDMPLLASNEEGTQLYIEGGDQTVDLRPLAMQGRSWQKDRIVLGTFAEPSEELERLQRKSLERGDKYHPWNITYQTRKSFDDFELVDYQHDLGEPGDGERGRKSAPQLEYEPQNEQLYICGGEYHIELPLFGVSPGIES